MMMYYNNPQDKESVEALRALFLAGSFPAVVNQPDPVTGKGVLSLLSEDMNTEHARIDDVKKVRPAAFTWMDNQDKNMRSGKTIDLTSGAAFGVKSGRGQGQGRRQQGGGGQ